MLTTWGFAPSLPKTWLTKIGVVELDWPEESNDLNPRIPLTSSWSTIVPLMLSLNPLHKDTVQLLHTFYIVLCQH